MQSSPVQSPSRRRFLECLAFAAALPLPAAKAATEPSLRFPTDPRARLSVTSYPFRAYIESPATHSETRAEPRIDMLQFPALIAEKFGVYNVNPLIDHFRSTDLSYFDQFRKALSAARSHIVDLGLPGREFYSSDRNVSDAAVQDGCKWIDMARALGSPSVRQHVKGIKGEKPDIGRAALNLGKLAEYGAKQNVVVNLENDNPVAEDPFFLTAIIEKVSNPYLRALPDFGNALLAHDADFNVRAVSAMLRHAFNMCHVKNFVETKAGTKASVDLRTMFRLARTGSYKGYFSMECETRGQDPFTGTRDLVNETLKYLASA